MTKRKIQLIAGSTYTISLPKKWVQENNLKEKDEIEIYEKEDKDLLISPKRINGKKIKEISINIEDYSENIDQILFAVYYLGIENINISSKKEIKKCLKTKIRKSIKYLSGTEIIYEDKNKISLRVLLDKSRVDIRQIIYRISLIIDSSIEDLTDGLDMEEIKINEEEIDRLYHLATKIITLSLRDSNILESSKIYNISLVPFYFLTCKKLENIGDKINKLSQYVYKNKIKLQQEKKTMLFIKDKINSIAKHVLKGFDNHFKKTSEEEINRLQNELLNFKKEIISDCIGELLRYLLDIEEEITLITYYTALMKE